ncbi:UDP-N-acetyl-alpha-D-glucosamine C6 dehydratase [Alkalithermobacter paradoxus]|uniref:UDP-N-acetyl-alpha-D-glucosamine C6 dehydratase n=2 Tax=Alkalithermobacter paradoxus TaxID=29349 RepID=A0A1V4I5R1_9FIRM|nr:UDP-N-acetyl-alpha-D-glucosamine C6 dehydratase [[Clostridium] thermoalcaliphilum]
MNKIRFRQGILLILDIILVNIAAILSLELIFNFNTSVQYVTFLKQSSIIYTFIIIATFYIFKCYKSLWRYASIEEMISIIISSVLSMIAIYNVFHFTKATLPINFYILNTLMLIGLTGGLRFSYRAIRKLKIKYSLKNGSRVLIIGGGVAGALVIKELFNNPQIKKFPVGIIDDDNTKLGRAIHGVPVLGDRQRIKEIVGKKKVDEIIIAIPSMSKSEKSKLIEMCKETKCKLKTLPGMYEIIDGRVDIKNIRDVDIEDLLGREPIKVNLEEISDYIQNEVVLVTGGGGSIGSELCRQIARFNPKELILLDIYENNAYEIQQELIRKYKDKLNLKVIIASVRDKKRMEQIFIDYNPKVVFHAAAHKHVPLMEDSPTEAVKNNVFGTLNVAELSDKYNIKRFVLISTDKAVNPTNIMGATKRMAEIIIQTLNKHSDTEFVAVRFGNVLGSNGSVIPLFKKQIAEGGPVTITHPDIIRYFMTIPEAVQLVIQAGAMAKGGEIFVLDMGDPVKITNLAKDLIKLSGLEPDVDIEIKFTGLRPGEKLYEELLMAEEGLTGTKHKKIFVGKPIDIDVKALYNELEILQNVVRNEENELVDIVIKKMVPTYTKSVS